MGAGLKCIAIIGAGPAGSALAAYLASAGCQVAMFGLAKRPELIIGESLVPAVIPILRELQIEEEVRQYSTLKPGASFLVEEGFEISFSFDQRDRLQPGYAYNVPRDRFDQSLRTAAIAAGARLFVHRARLAPGSTADCATLSEDTLAATDGFLTKQPDLIVDASGRAQVLAKAFGIKSDAGPRHDVALFAHLDDAEVTHPGNVHIDRLTHGWSWRVPLPGRMSVGIVAAGEFVETQGSTAAEQFDRILTTEPNLCRYCQGSNRISRVMTYDNYQARNERLTGPGWALVGDAAGFVDPTFSSGLHIALSGARRLADAIKRDRCLANYEKQTRGEIDTWGHITDAFYDGRLFTLFRVGQEFSKSILGRLLDSHIEKHIARVITGGGIAHPYSRRLLFFLLRHALGGSDPNMLRIR